MPKVKRARPIIWHYTKRRKVSKAVLANIRKCSPSNFFCAQTMEILLSNSFNFITEILPAQDDPVFQYTVELWDLYSFDLDISGWLTYDFYLPSSGKAYVKADDITYDCY